MLLDWLHRMRQRLPATRGRRCAIHPTARFLEPDNISLGDFVLIGPRCLLEGKGGIEIGDGTSLAPQVTILSSSHQWDNPSLLPYHEVDEHRRVEVGRGVWIGFGAMLAPGVRLDDGAVVAMGAVVTRSVAKGQVVGGNPARVIAARDPELVERLVAERAYFRRRHPGGAAPRPGVRLPVRDPIGEGDHPRGGSSDAA